VRVNPRNLSESLLKDSKLKGLEIRYLKKGGLVQSCRQELKAAHEGCI